MTGPYNILRKNDHCIEIYFHTPSDQTSSYIEFTTCIKDIFYTELHIDIGPIIDEDELLDKVLLNHIKLLFKVE